MNNSGVSFRWVRGAVRRSLPVLLTALLLGSLFGVAWAALRPPQYSSTTLVLLPDRNGLDTSSPNAAPDVATQVQIVQSTSVLGAAGQKLTPKQTYRQMEERVTAEAVTDRMMKITAKDTGPSGAQAIATQVTNAYMDYVQQHVQVAASTVVADLQNRQKALAARITAVDATIKATAQRQQQVSPTSAVAQREAELMAQLQIQRADLQTQMDKVQDRIATTVTPSSSTGIGVALAQPASPGQATSIFWWALLWGVTGALIGGLLAVVAILVRARRDHRLWLRDQIADAVGSPVLAAVDARPQTSSRDWFALMKSYRPPAVQAWSLRQVLRVPASDAARAPRVIDLISLASDAPALALGPQLASFAAVSGINTHYLIADGAQRAATLWQSVSGVQQGPPRLGLFVGDAPVTDVDLVVRHHIVDRSAPQLTPLVSDGTVLLAVAAGAATDAELARVALAVDGAGARISGVLLADPDPSDETSGRRAPQSPARPVALPNRMTGMSAGTERRLG